MPYLKRKKITLPSGASARIRPISANDYLAEFGNVPIGIRRQLEESMKSKKENEIGEKEIDFVRRLGKIVLLKCCGAIDSAEGRLVIVDKPQHECSDTEVSIEEIPQSDANHISDEVFKISGMTKEAADISAKFPEQQATDGNTPQAGETIRSSPVCVAESDSARVGS